MAGNCAICGKGSQHGQNIRHRHSGSWALRAPRTKNQWRPNLQTVHTLVKGTPTRLKVCTRCLKAGKVLRAV
ncbi:MAG: 50S ribosomal protein L28 [Armatimonadetes bacterium]|nr:50S ribosomal protein L28 [Armatimonadota bacterium]